MKRILFLLALLSTLFSCQSDDVCQCLTESTAQRKKNRLEGKVVLDPKSPKSCKALDERYKGSNEEVEKLMAEMKACPNYKAFIEEMRLSDEFALEEAKKN
jgi:hypothetical protein